jgi:Spy/CpxP family protein refolding chaperone
MKHITIALGLALISSLALGQPEGGAPQSGSDHKRAMLRQLDLSSEQREKIREIRTSGGGRDEVRAVLTEDQQSQLRKLKKGSSGERAQRMQAHLGLSDEQAEQIKSIREAGGSREEVRAVLTEEQQAKFDAVKKHHTAE